MQDGSTSVQSARSADRPRMIVGHGIASLDSHEVFRRDGASRFGLLELFTKSLDFAETFEVASPPVRKREAQPSTRRMARTKTN